jgi:hypothetical protein
LPPHVVEPALRRLLVEFRSSLAVTADGELLYRFDPLFVRRSDKLRAFLSTLATVLVVTFKVITGVVLILYVGVFVALAIPEVGLPQIIRASILGLRQPHRLRRIRSFAALVLAKTVSLAQKVFAFIFGPSLPTPDEFADEKDLLAFLRANKGVIAQSEILMQTGWPSEVADQESTRLVARYGGDVEMDEGQLLYVFRELGATAETCANEAYPPPCWERLESPVELTGNSFQEDGVIAIVNAYVLLAATVLLPLAFAPHLGIDLALPYARWGLVYIPALYSLGAFLIYFVRRRWLAPAEDRRRLARNIRRLLLREAFFGRTVDCKALFAEASSFPVTTTLAAVERMAQDLAIELSADIEPEPSGGLRIDWTQFQAGLAGVGRYRGRQSQPALGDVIYSSDDSSGCQP